MLESAAEWLAAKATGEGPRVPSDGDPAFVDAFRSMRQPTQSDLLAQCRRVAYACATINANAVSSVPLRLFAVTRPGEARPKCSTRPVTKSTELRLRSLPGLAAKLAGAVEVHEVAAHPLLELLDAVNPWMQRTLLLGITQFSQEVLGNAFWLLEDDETLGIPRWIWPLPAQHVRLQRDARGMIAEFAMRTGATETVFPAQQVVHFKFPSLRDLYGLGLAPLEAAYEDSVVDGKLLAHEHAMLENQARPDMLVSPGEQVGKAEAARLEQKLKRKFRRGGAGGILVAESAMKISPLTFPPRQLEGVARRQLTKTEIANVFGVPISLLETRDVNRANAEAGHYQHARLAVLPRCSLLQGALNERLCPRYDERLFLAFDDPVPANSEQIRLDHQAYLGAGVMTVNEVRAGLGLAPVAWGEVAWIPMSLVPAGEEQPAPSDAVHDEEEAA